MSNNLTIEEIKELFLSKHFQDIKSAIEAIQKNVLHPKSVLLELILTHYRLLSSIDKLSWGQTVEAYDISNQIQYILFENSSSELKQIIEDNTSLFDLPEFKLRKDIVSYERWFSSKIKQIASMGEIDGIKFVEHLIKNKEDYFSYYVLMSLLENLPGTTYLIEEWRRTKNNSILDPLLKNEFKIGLIDLALTQEEFEILFIYISSFEQIDVIEFLIFDSNQIEYLPKEIGNFKNLKEISLQDNQLKELPEEIGFLNKLEALIISGNKLQQLPLSVTRLQSLKMLFIDDNKLKVLSKEMGQLKSLTNLYLGNNQLEVLPSSIKELSKLKILDIKNNLLSNDQIHQIKEWLPNCEIWI